jgi:predicted MPP superfamily phosphohydrolase
VHPGLRLGLRGAAATAALGAGVLAYSAGYEVRAFTLRRATVPVLPAGQRPLTMLHLSDLHLTPRQGKKMRWVRELDDLEPDLVVGTGDFLAHQQAIPALVSALGPLLDRPGAFVLGSNDYYAPIMKNPARYLVPDTGRRIHGTLLPWRELRDTLGGYGWADLTNARAVLEVDERRLDLRGVDDPHIRADRYQQVAGPFDDTADLALGVVHAPYRRVLDAMVRDGADMIVAGHTHGGQLAIPGFGAVVTNCDIDRRRAKGLHHHKDAWLHVSAGLGTSPYAPVRFACRPEATLLTLVPAVAPAGGRGHLETASAPPAPASRDKNAAAA